MENDISHGGHFKRWLIFKDDTVLTRDAEFNHALRLVQEGTDNAAAFEPFHTGPLILEGIDLVVMPNARVSKHLILLIDEAFGRIMQCDRESQFLSNWTR